MQFKQIDKIYVATMKNAMLWAEEKDCEPIYQEDLLIIGECLKINLHKCFYNFESSDNINHVKAFSSHKTIHKQLDKIRKGLQSYSLV